DVRADHILDRVEHGRVVDDLIDKGEQQMRLEVMALAELLPLRRLEVLHGPPVAPRLFRAERVDRIEKTLAVILRNLRVGQFFAHGFSEAVPGTRCSAQRCTVDPGSISGSRVCAAALRAAARPGQAYTFSVARNPVSSRLSARRRARASAS